MNTLPAEELTRLHAAVNNIDEAPDNESIGLTVTVVNCNVQSITVTLNPTESTQTIVLQIQRIN